MESDFSLRKELENYPTGESHSLLTPYLNNTSMDNAEVLQSLKNVEALLRQKNGPTVIKTENGSRLAGFSLNIDNDNFKWLLLLGFLALLVVAALCIKYFNSRKDYHRLRRKYKKLKTQKLRANA